MVRERYISIDIETTGLDPETCQILEIGAVIEDWKTPILELPTFQCFVQHDEYRGQPHAFVMNSRILKILASPERPIPFDTIYNRANNIIHPYMIVNNFINWLRINGIDRDVKFTVAGKNFGSFDLQFLKRLNDFGLIKFRHRYIDPGMLYWEPDHDATLPDMKECLARAGIMEKVSHCAVEDAQQVIKLIRHHFNLRDKWRLR